jgi:signal transduction histidine kinase/ligand-binding sensor domain-containing protein
MMLRSFWPVLVLMAWPPASAWAVDPAKPITQYAHTSWGMQDGVFNSTPLTIVQTPDGYIWIGGPDGVMQFDGARFVRWTPGHGQRLPNAEVLQLSTTRDGSVWISAVGFLSRWKDRTLTNYATAANGPNVVADDSDGRVWLGRTFAGNGASPLCQVLENSLRCLGQADGMPSFNATTLLADRDGTLWLGGDILLVRWTRRTPTIYRLPGLAANAGIDGVAALAATPDGTVWVGIARAGPGLGLQRLVDGRWQSFDTPALHGSSLAVTSLHADREGSLWVGTYDRGLYRLRGNIVDHFDRSNGLSSNFVRDLAEDREGNIWVVTSHGVDRFADLPVVSVSVAEGLCSPEASSVLAARDGSIWTGGDGALTRLHDGGVTCFRKGRELPGSQVTSLFEDHAGRLWVGLDQGLWLYEGGRFLRVTRPDGRPIGMVTGIAEDTDRRIWIAATGPPRQLMRVEGLTVREDLLEPPMPRRVALDPTGGLWLGLFNGDLAHVRDGRTDVHAIERPENALIEQLLPEADGSVLAATTYGLLRWRDGKASTLTQRNGLPCEQVYAIAFDRRGDLWLYMNCALGMLTRAEFEAWKQNPGRAVTIRALDALDGVRPNPAAFGAGARSPDGRLWFANGSSVQVFDPARLGRNTIPPPVHIEQVVADRRAYPAVGSLRLPPLTRDLQVDYVGLSFVAPQKVRFRYRLDGRDDTWQEPGTRRQAFYTDLRPGTYTFRVIASNNDGVWNEHGASLEIVVAPAWYQTGTFVALCTLASALALWVAYGLRMRHVARALNARFDERLAERTRMARDLHDTLLQTVQGSKMVADTALDRPDDAPALARALQQVSAWLGQAGEQGRAAVSALRTSTTESNNLADAFRRAVLDCQRQGTIAASLTVTGEAREMHPVVRDELYRIGYEAIRNACAHSRGSRLDVALSYGHDLTLRVADDGVGIELTTVERGRDGHFGLPGMRERAARIGASLSVNSAPGTGTAILLTVPGRLVFRKPSTRLATRVRSMFSGAGETTRPH